MRQLASSWVCRCVVSRSVLSRVCHSRSQEVSAVCKLSSSKYTAVQDVSLCPPCWAKQIRSPVTCARPRPSVYTAPAVLRAQLSSASRCRGYRRDPQSGQLPATPGEGGALSEAACRAGLSSCTRLQPGVSSVNFCQVSAELELQQCCLQPVAVDRSGPVYKVGRDSGTSRQLRQSRRPKWRTQPYYRSFSLL